MKDRDEFMDEIRESLTDWADDFDIEAITDEVSDFDERRGYVWAPRFDSESDEYDPDAYWRIVESHCIAEEQ